jgi:hypothetical protein
MLLKTPQEVNGQPSMVNITNPNRQLTVRARLAG